MLNTFAGIAQYFCWNFNEYTVTKWPKTCDVYAICCSWYTDEKLQSGTDSNAL